MYKKTICRDESCDQAHCGKCGCHTVGNSLMAGKCQDCYVMEEDEYQRYMEMQWSLHKAGCPSVFDR